MNRVISISGAQGVGKTTLIAALSAEGFHVITPSASNIAAGLQFGSAAEKQAYIVDTMSRQLGQALGCDGDVYLDRSALDCYSYMKLDGKLSPKEKAPFERRLRVMARQLTHAFIPKPGEFAIQANGIRSLDATYQQEWHAALVAFAKECGVPYTELSGTVAERLATILHTFQ